MINIETNRPNDVSKMEQGHQIPILSSKLFTDIVLFFDTFAKFFLCKVDAGVWPSSHHQNVALWRKKDFLVTHYRSVMPLSINNNLLKNAIKYFGLTEAASTIIKSPLSSNARLGNVDDGSTPLQSGCSIVKIVGQIMGVLPLLLASGLNNVLNNK
jgi:hypothetical protein